MKTRIAIAGSLTILVFILLPIALIFSELRDQGIFSISAIVLLVYIGMYVFGGVAKLIVYLIYGVITTMFLLFLPEGYQLPFVIIGTLLFVLNPLAILETWFENHLKDEDVLPIRISLYGSYWPFYSYRKEMKNFYHLPQARKLYTKRWYLYMRQMTTLTLLLLGVFLFINQINNIKNSLNDFSLDNFMIFYLVIIVFILTFILFKKGFSSTFRVFVIGLFPVMIYLVLISEVQSPLKFILAIAVLIMFVVVSVYEFVMFYQRVAYDAYRYYDVDQQKEVNANALFEPLVYNESYTKCAHYQIKVKPETFQKQWHDIQVYANYFRFIITAYAYGRQMVHVHADFHHNQAKRAERFKVWLESRFKMAIPLDLVDDPGKTRYEQMFFHRPGYIIARAQNLAQLLLDLEIESKIILSFILYFETEDELAAFALERPLTRLDEMSSEHVKTVRVDVPTLNDAFLIEAKVTEVLLDMMTHRGRFVRISVYY